MSNLQRMKKMMKNEKRETTIFDYVRNNIYTTKFA